MRAQDMAWIVPAGVAIVSGAVYVAILGNRIANLEQLRPTLERERIDAIERIANREQEALATLTDIGPARLGIWEDRSIETAYLAETDGFVVAYVEPPAVGFNILFWEGSEEPPNPPILTRDWQYGGTMCPIPQGTGWKVIPFTSGGRPVYGPIRVRWLPIVREQP